MEKVRTFGELRPGDWVIFTEDNNCCLLDVESVANNVIVLGDTQRIPVDPITGKDVTTMSFICGRRKIYSDPKHWIKTMYDILYEFSGHWKNITEEGIETFKKIEAIEKRYEKFCRTTCRG